MLLRLLRQQWPSLLAAAGVGVALEWLAADSWSLVLLDGLACTVLAILLPQYRVAWNLGPPLPVRLRVALPLAAAWLLLLGRLTPWSQHAGLPLGDRAGALLVLSAWVLCLALLAEVTIRRWGAGGASLLATALPGALLLTGPISLQAFFPLAIRPVLLASPVIGAARALGLDVIHQPVIYDLTPLDALEFHYPAWYLILLLFLALAGLLGGLAALCQEEPR